MRQPPEPTREPRAGPAEYFFYLLFHTARLRDASWDEALKPLDLNVSRWRVLSVVRRTPDCTLSRLARLTAIERTTLTRAVDQLVAAGLMERWTPARDRRQVNLALTPKGLELCLRAGDVLADRCEDVLTKVSEKQLQDAIHAIQNILRALAPHPDHATELFNIPRTFRLEE